MNCEIYIYNAFSGPKFDDDWQLKYEGPKFDGEWQILLQVTSINSFIL